MSTLRQYIRHRYDTGTNWTATNPVLRAGELGIESDASSLRGKIGDGVTAWTALPYTQLGQRPDFESVQFDLAAGITPVAGQLAWNADESTIALGKGAITNYLGEETVVMCRNASNTVAIPKGTAVMFAGTLGASGRLKVAPMIADGTQPGYVFFGVTAEAIAGSGDGYVSVFGKIKGINTSAYAEETILWCDPAVPGGFTATEPAAPNLKLAVAAVISSKNNGTIFVRWTTGSRLQDLHDVEANGGKVDGDVLTYVAANNRWEPMAPTGAISTHEAAADPHPGYALESSLATVATTGAYGDLTGTPSVSDVFIIPCSDETSDLTVGADKARFTTPYAGTLTAVKADVNTAPTGSTLVVDINEAGVSVLSTKLSIDAGETSSSTATSPPVISDSALANGAVISIDIDQIGSTVAGAGLKITFYVTRS